MIDIKSQEIEPRIVEASDKLKEAAMYDYLRNSIGPIKGRITGDQLNVAQSLETALAVYSTVFETVEAHMETNTYDPESEDFRGRRVFANRYALYVGSEMGLRSLHGGKPPKTDARAKTLDLLLTQEEMGEKLADNFTRFLKRTNAGEPKKMEEVADLYLNSIKRAALDGSQRYEPIFTDYPDLEFMTVLSTDFKRFSSLEATKPKETLLTFDDYAGQDGVKAELQAVAEFIKDPRALRMWGGDIPTGYILCGPGGVGKTYLAEVFADVCGLPFHHIKLSDILQEFYGKGTRLVQEHFTKPGIIFIDEFDSAGRKIGDQNTHEATEQITNTIKAVMSGFGNSIVSHDDPITFYLAASNNLENIDPTLIRPGRFKPIVMEAYDAAGMAQVYKVQERLRAKSSTGEITIFNPEIDTETIGTIAAGRELTPADVKYILQGLTNKRAVDQMTAGLENPLPPISEGEIVDAIATYERSDESVFKTLVGKVAAGQ